MILVGTFSHNENMPTKDKVLERVSAAELEAVHLLEQALHKLMRADADLYNAQNEFGHSPETERQQERLFQAVEDLLRALTKLYKRPRKPRANLEGTKQGRASAGPER